jgi:hypothetical protein
VRVFLCTVIGILMSNAAALYASEIGGPYPQRPSACCGAGETRKACDGVGHQGNEAKSGQIDS